MSDDKDLYLDAGKLLVFSHGEYSDFGYDAMFVTLQPILRSRMQECADEALAEWRKNDAAQDDWTEASGVPYPPSTNKQGLFISALIRAGLLMIIDYTEAHLGSYGELELP